MLRLSTALLFCLLLLGGYEATAQVPRVLGVWKLDLDASDVPERFPVASEIRRYSLRDDGYLVILAIRMDANGNPEFIQIAAKSDGRDYPQYQSAPLADFQIHETTTPFTYAESIVDENTVATIGRYNGQIINKGTRTISDGGRTMTLNVTAVLQNGQELPFVLVFYRQSQ